MRGPLSLSFAVSAVLAGVWLVTGNAAQSQRALPEDLRREIETGRRELEKSLGEIDDRTSSELADAAIFQKGLTWALRYDREFTEADIALMQKAIVRGRQRTKSLAAG